MLNLKMRKPNIFTSPDFPVLVAENLEGLDVILPSERALDWRKSEYRKNNKCWCRTDWISRLRRWHPLNSRRELRWAWGAWKFYVRVLASVKVVDQCARQKGLTSQHPTHPVPLSDKVIKADTVFMHVMLPSIPSSSDLTTSHERTHTSKQTCFYRQQQCRWAGNPKDKTTWCWKLAHVTGDLQSLTVCCILVL